MPYQIRMIVLRFPLQFKVPNIAQDALILDTVEPPVLAAVPANSSPSREKRKNKARKKRQVEKIRQANQAMDARRTEKTSKENSAKLLVILMRTDFRDLKYLGFVLV